MRDDKTEGLSRWLNARFGAEPFPLRGLSPFHLAVLCQNAQGKAGFPPPEPDPEILAGLTAWVIPESEKSQIFYQEERTPVPLRSDWEPPFDRRVFVFVHENGYVESNSPRLQLLLLAMTETENPSLCRYWRQEYEK